MNDSASGADLMIEDVSVLDGDTTSGGSLTTSLTAAGNTGAWAAANGAWVTGQVVLDSDKSFTLTTGNATDITTAVGTFGGQLQSVDKLDVSTVDASNRTLALVDSALAAVNSQRARYGALQSRFESSISNLQATSENLSASRSRIRDTDFAAETANLTRAQILQQAGTAMLSQANALPQNVLSLLG